MAALVVAQTAALAGDTVGGATGSIATTGAAGRIATIGAATLCPA